MTTISLYTGDVPALNQAQPTFDTNTQDFIDYIATLAPEINTFAGLLNAISTTDTSVTSNTVGTGSKTFTVSSGKSFFVGMSLTIANTAAPTNRMFAIVTSYSGTSLQVTSQAFEGSGTFTAWSISASFNGVISTGQLADLGTTTGKLANDSVTSEKLADSALGGVLINGYINVPAPSGNALTINIKTKAGTDPSATDPVLVVFRNSSLTTSGYVVRSITAATSITISSGSTLGSINAILARIAVLVLDNAGTVELAVNNMSGGVQLDETNLISTTAEGGAGAADSATVVYSTTARSNLAYRVAGFLDSTQATAGTYVTAPSLVQNCFGQALASMSSLGYGQTWQNVTGSRAFATTYYNATGKPILVHIQSTIPNSSSAITLTVNGVSMGQISGSASAQGLETNALIPVGGSYSLAQTGTAPISIWNELR